MRQTWRQLTFLHWPYQPDAVRPLLPAGLELDTFENAAWVGLIPFEIHNLTGLPHFPETNVRTYVTGPDRGRGVWFFSLDAARLLAVIGARAGYGLPYYWASMRVASENGNVRYRSRRKWPHRPGSTDILIEPGAPYSPDELAERDHFFTARYCLYTLLRGRLGRAQIEHPPWPLARATVVDLNQTLIEVAGFPSPQGPPIVHFARSLDVKIGYPRVVTATKSHH
ncbi:MAG TPA: DUF2071 domain-containing protein [Bryobacteraceae bacterium]|nr:DUF2071 domain-containing protein [Bryobacteraceae bacterium]